MIRRLQGPAGFSLVEVVLAIGVASFCLLTVLALLPTGLKTNQIATDSTKANQVISQIIADLRADVRLPPGQASKESTQGFSLHGHWAAVATPDTIYFTQDGRQTGQVNQGTVPADAAFAATVRYLFPPTLTTSIAQIVVAWPAASVHVDPNTGVIDTTSAVGSVNVFTAVNR